MAVIVAGWPARGRRAFPAGRAGRGTRGVPGGGAAPGRGGGRGAPGGAARRRGRWGRPARILAGMTSSVLVRPPDSLVSGEGRVLAVKGEDGRLLVKARRSDFATDTWLRRAGQEERDDWPDEGTGVVGPLACDPLGCLYRARGHLVALAWSTDALAED